VIIPAVLAILLVVAIGFAICWSSPRRRREGRASGRHHVRDVPGDAIASAPSASANHTTQPRGPLLHPVAVIGADCSPLGSTGTTANGADTYCSTLQNTNASIWSLTQGTVPAHGHHRADRPTIAHEEESPVRVCMQQTGQTRGMP